MKETRPKTTEQPQEMTYADAFLQYVEDRKSARITDKQQTTNIDQKAVTEPASTPSGASKLPPLDSRFSYSKNNVPLVALGAGFDELELVKDKRFISTKTYRGNYNGVTVEVNTEEDLGNKIAGFTPVIKQALCILNTMLCSHIGKINTDNQEQVKRAVRENKKFTFTADELLENSGFTNKKEAIRSFLERLWVLDTFRVSYITELNGEIIEAKKAPILSEPEYKKGKGFSFYFGDTYLLTFIKSYLTIYAKEIITLNPNKNALAIDLGYIFYTQKRRNKDIIETTLSIEQLYIDCPSLRKIEVKKKGNFKGQVLKAIKNNMELVFNSGDWIFIDKSGHKRTIEDLPNNEKYFKDNILIRVFWKHFPTDKEKKLHKNQEKRDVRQEKILLNKAKKANKPRKQPQ